MELDEFLHRVLPPDGTYFAAIEPKNGHGFRQKQADSINGLYHTIQHSVLNDDVAAYFATSSYKNGSTNRTANNIDNKKALYLDMDCGSGKGFPNQKNAIVELYNFCTNVRIPKPNILVNSGNGVHAYWTFDKAISHSEWIELADILKQLCADNNFPADPSVTSDGTRVLRAPGSINKKDPANPKKCTVLHARPDYPIDKLAKIIRAHSNKPSLPNVPMLDNDDLAIERHDQNWYAKYIFQNCATMKAIKDTGGAECNEPLWMQTLNLLAYCEDGASYIHPVSNKHATYNARATEQKFNLRLKAKADGNSGPTLCKTFQMYPQNKCEGCPYLNDENTKSPISLGKPPPPPPEEIPFPFKQDARGIYQIVEGERQNISPYQIKDFRLFYNPLDDKLIRHITFQIGNSKPVIVKLDSLAARSLFDTMSQYGVDVHRHSRNAMEFLMTSWSTQLQDAKKYTVMNTAYGWDQNLTHFTVGKKLLSADGTEEERPTHDPVLERQYEPHGNYDKWKEAAQLMADTCPSELYPILASAFAAPLVDLTGIKGAMLSVVSKQSGTGKSTAIQIAQSVWGDPMGINQLDDTENSVAMRLATLSNLPLYWDELRAKKDIDRFLKLIFRVGQGRDKQRLNSQVQQREAGSWSTLIVSASNAPLKDYVDANVTDTNAAMQRIFEISMEDTAPPPLNVHKKTTLNNVMRNYGHAGLEYAAYVVQNRDAITKQIQGLEARLIEGTNAEQAERFWITLVAILLIGAAIAKKLDILSLDLKTLKDVLMANITEMREVTELSTSIHSTDSTPLGLVDQFIHEYEDHTYITERFPDSRGEVGKYIRIPDRRPVTVWIEKEFGMARLDKKAFRDWLMRNGYQQATVIKALVKNHGMQELRTIIRPNTDDDTPPRIRIYQLRVEEV